MEVAFANQDWFDVIRKADYIVKRLPESATASVYRLQGLAYIEEGETQHGQEALETDLALVNDRQLRLTLLGDYTALLVSQNQWAKVLKRAKEALRLVPNDPGWLAIQEQAQSQLVKASPTQPPAQIQTRNKETPSVPQKTKSQWLKEGDELYNLKRNKEAIRLDPNFAIAYSNKGLALDQLGKSSKAKLAYDKARQLGYTG